LLTKFNLEVKKKFIDLMKSNKYSIGKVATELGVSNSVAERWWRMYKIHGDEGLTMKSGRYTGEFKVHVVKYMHKDNLSLREASTIFGIPSEATVLNWNRIYIEKGEMGLLDQTSGRPRKDIMKENEIKVEDNSLVKQTEDNVNLLDELKRLRAEVAYLKKSIALKEEKRSLQTKKRQW
jgi:transposase